MPARKKDVLLNCARRLFETEGFRATGIDRVLAEAGVAKMTLYNNFGSKDGLIVAVLERTSEEMVAMLERTIEEQSSDPYEQILGVFDAFAQWFANPEFCGCMFQAAVAEFSDPESQPAQAARGHQIRVSSMFGRLCREAELPNPENLGKMLAMLASGASCTARQVQAREPADHARQIAEILLERACSGSLKMIETVVMPNVQVQLPR